MLARLLHQVECARHHQAELLLGRLCRMHDAHHPAMAEHHDLIAQREHDVQILADEQHARPRLLLTVEDVVNEVGRIDVQPAHGIRRDEHVGLRENLAPQKHFLHVAARKPSYRRLGGRRGDVQLLNDALRLGARRLAVDEHPVAVKKTADFVERAAATRLEGLIPLLHSARHKSRAVACVILEHHIVRDGHRGRKPHAEAVLRDKAHGDALGADRLGRQTHDALALVEDPARLHLSQPRDRLAQFALSAARNAGDAQDLAAADEEAQIFDGAAAHIVLDTQVADLEERTVKVRLGALDGKLNLLPDHHLGERRLRRLRRIDAAHGLALAKDGDAVGDRHDLVQLMGDDDDRLAVLFHGAHDGKELLRLLRRQNRRRLVQNENICAAVEHFDDLHRLLFRDGHVVDLLFGIDVKAVLLGDRADLFIDAPRAVALFLLDAEHDVLRRREDIDELEVLMHHADLIAEGILRRGDDDLLPVDEDLSFVGIVDAGDHVHERRLAAAVLAEQSEDLAFPQGETDALVRRDRSEIFADVFEFQGDVHFGTSQKNV